MKLANSRRSRPVSEKNRSSLVAPRLRLDAAPSSAPTDQVYESIGALEVETNGSSSTGPFGPPSFGGGGPSWPGCGGLLGLFGSFGLLGPGCCPPALARSDASALLVFSISAGSAPFGSTCSHALMASWYRSRKLSV